VRPESDRNLGGFFIIFGRLFGTYTPTRPHDRPPEYGLPGGQARTFKEAALGELFRFFRAFRARDGLAKRLRFALTRPLTSPDETTHPSG